VKKDNVIMLIISNIINITFSLKPLFKTPANTIFFFKLFHYFCAVNLQIIKEMMALMINLMITWTDIFEGIGKFFQWAFKGIKALEQIPNVLISAFVIGMLTYWTFRLLKYRKEAQRNGTIQ